jgi:hypothetical protein
MDQGGASLTTRAPLTQDLTQSPQKVHSLWVKSTTGNPPSPFLIICVGQTVAQSPQRVQRAKKSTTAQGGRGAAGVCGRRPKSRLRREGSTSAANQNIKFFRLGERLNTHNASEEV